MANDIPVTQISEVLTYLFETAGQHITQESGLRPELHDGVRRGYDTALEHLAYALNLPASIHQVSDESVPVYRRLRARFPAPGARDKTKTYRGIRLPDENAVYVNDKRLAIEPSQKIKSFAPAFEWGYEGSGPMQLALAILLDYFVDEVWAKHYHQRFTWNVVSRWPQDSRWSLTGEEIERACQVIDRENPLSPIALSR